MHTACSINSFVPRFFLALSVFLMSVVSVEAQKKQAKPKADPFAVVKVDSEIRIVKKSAVKGVKLEIAQDYKRDVKAFTQAKKQAKKDKVKFSSPKPKKKKFKILKASCKTEADAQKFVAALEKKARKTTRAKRGG